jgi:hypothetical protein
MRQWNQSHSIFSFACRGVVCVGMSVQGCLLPCLPSDLHGLVYSYLDWKEKKIFISLCKEIYSLSRRYREIRLTKPSSLEYALNKESFRERVYSLALPCHMALRFCESISAAGNTSDCLRITDAGLANLGNVKEIDLSGCRQITNEGLRHLRNLQSLDLSNCREITDEGLLYLGNVKVIKLGGCEQITDAGLRHLGNVQSLDLSCCRKITDAGLAYLGNVKEIDLRLSSDHQ